MRKAVLTLVLAVSVIVTAGAAPIPHVLTSLVKIYHEDGVGECTAFAIRMTRYITAGHCVDGAQTLLVVYGTEKAIGRVLYESPEHDLAVFECEEIMRPGLKLGAKPGYGDTLMAFGFGADMPVPVYFSLDALGEFVPFEGFPEKLVMNHALVPGMSGGPIVNAAGEVVSVNQISSQSYGLSGGAAYAHLKALYKRF